MYDVSKEYIERLLKESGVKPGSAKASARLPGGRTLAPDCL